MATDTTSEGKVIELKDGVIWGGIAIALGDVIDVCIIDVHEEPTESNGLVAILTFGVEITG